MRHTGPQSLPATASTVVAEHVRVGPGLINEHQAIGVEVELALEPGPAPAQDVGPVLLGGVERLFMRVIR
jgi:hypothetical protein